jgi:hypothetical protein
MIGNAPRSSPAQIRPRRRKLADNQLALCGSCGKRPTPIDVGWRNHFRQLNCLREQITGPVAAMTPSPPAQSNK